MCTNILESVAVEGSGKGARWFPLAQASVTYDHPQHLSVEHAVNIDFVDRSGGLDGRVGVELTLESARGLAGALLEAVAQAEAFEGYPSGPTASSTAASRAPDATHASAAASSGAS